VLLWSFIYGVPAALMLFFWTAFLTRNRDQMKNRAAWVALFGATYPALAGVYALTHVYKMAARVSTDYRFEKTALGFAILAVIAVIVWLRRSRQFSSWGTLAVAIWMGIVWTAVLNPF
jgi:uncharacterized membrane protein